MCRLKVIDEKHIPSIMMGLERNRDENHFFLSYMKKLKAGKDYTILKYGSTYILDIKRLITALSYTDENEDGIDDILSGIQSRMIIAPGKMICASLSSLDADEKRIENLMAYGRTGRETPLEPYILSKLSDYADLLSFYEHMPEYAGYYTYSDMVKKHQNSDCTHFASAIREKGIIVSALIMNEGLISSVGTLQKFRGMGFASRNIRSAVYHYLRTNPCENSVYLFYNNEKNAELYRTLGFYDVCPFMIIKRKI